MEQRIAKLELKANEFRNIILDICCGAGAGHIVSSFSCAEILTALYYGGVLNFKVSDYLWSKRDRFILSKGHASVILYAILADLGFIAKDVLRKFNRNNGLIGPHLRHDIAGVEISSGSLGNGLGIGAGMALAAKMNKEEYLTFVLMSDGECYEGAVWESAMFAGHHRLKNLVAIIDRNFLCATDFTEHILRLESLKAKWESFGWQVKEINGHDFKELLKAMSGLHGRSASKPLVIIAKTRKGQGVSFMCNKPLWHNEIPKGEQIINAKKELNAARKS